MLPLLILFCPLSCLLFAAFCAAPFLLRFLVHTFGAPFSLPLHINTAVSTRLSSRRLRSGLTRAARLGPDLIKEISCEAVTAGYRQGSSSATQICPSLALPLPCWRAGGR